MALQSQSQSSVVSEAAGVRTNKRVMAAEVDVEVGVQRHAEAIDQQSQELTQKDNEIENKKRRRTSSSRQEEARGEGEEDVGLEKTSRNRRKLSSSEAGANDNANTNTLVEPSSTRSIERQPKGSWRAGFIKRVHIENFMKHRNFTVDFGPNVTFISGKNGSGKSATLQAIQCCLGVKAKQMGRGNSIGSFVRHGSNSALVVVTLSNEGSDGYRREVFGSTITVERRIDRKGQGGFTIRDAKGIKVATKKWELENILDHLSLMISNPCVVTTQDIARTFLSGDTDDSSRYKLFMQATMLEVVKENLSGTSLTLDKMKELLVVKEKEVNKKLAEMKVVKKQRDRARSIANITVLERQCENLLVWSEVLNMEDKVKDIMHKVDTKAPALLEHLEEKMVSARATLEQAEATQQQRGEAVQNFTSEIEDLVQSGRNVKSNISKLAAQDVKQQNALERVKKEMGKLEQERRSLEEILREGENVDVSTTQAIKDGHQKEIDAKKKKLEWLRRQEENLKEDLNGMRNSLHEVEQDMNNLDHQKYRFEQVIKECQQNLRELSRPSASVDPDKFWKGYRVLGREIERNSRSFHRPPIGPIGIHLELTDHEVGFAVQAAIGNRLGSFIVHDEHDRIELQRCAQRAKTRTPVTITSSFDRPMIRIPQNQLPPRNYRTVLSVLKCTHPTCSHVILNMLIDYLRIESALLLDSFNQGKAAIFQKRAYPSTKGYLVSDGSLMELRGSTQINRTVLAEWQRPQLNKAGRDTAEDKVYYQEEIQKSQNELHNLSISMDALQEKKREISTDYKRCEEEVDKLGDSIITEDAEIQRTYDRMREALNEAAGDRGSNDPEGIKAQIADLQLKMDQNEAKGQSLEAVILQLGNEMNTLREQLEFNKAEREKLIQNNEEMMTNAQALDNEFQDAREEVEMLETEKGKINKKIAKLKQDLAKHKPIYDNKLRVAEETCPRDEVEQSMKGVSDHWDGTEIDLRKDEDISDIERLLKKIRANIKSFEKDSGSLEELELKFYQVEKDYERAQKMYMKVHDPYTLISSGVEDRWEKFESMRKSIGKQTNFRFMGFMGKRGYSGNLKVCHKTEKLKITVNVGDGKSASKKAGKVRDMKSLSGGERSLSTLCFVLSLATMCESPFRASDEFDVFMDAVNRKVSLRSLLHFAVESPDTQMILLTPQDLATVDEVKMELKENENYHEKFIKLIVMPSV